MVLYDNMMHLTCTLFLAAASLERASAVAPLPLSAPAMLRVSELSDSSDSSEADEGLATRSLAAQAREHMALEDGQCGLVRQVSFAPCELGRSFGCDPVSGSMWTRNCRGNFRCGSNTVHCGYPPGFPAYNCSCFRRISSLSARGQHGTSADIAKYFTCGPAWASDTNVSLVGGESFYSRLRRCHCNKTAEYPAVHSTLEVLLLGGSMAEGNMNCGRRLGSGGNRGGLDFPCVGHRRSRSKAWGALLQRDLGAALGKACSVSVAVSAKGGRTSEQTALEIDHVIGGGHWDAVILDQSINDMAFVHRQATVNINRKQKLLAAVESVVRRLVAKGSAVILVDSLDAPIGRFDCPDSSSPSIYRPIAKHWGLPYISLPRAVCDASQASSSEQALREVWRAGCSGLDAVGVDCFAHPGPSAHAMLSRLVARKLARVASGAKLPHRARGTLQPEFQVAGFEICSLGRGKSTLEFKCSGQECAVQGSQVSTRNFKAMHTVGWRAYVDRPGKPGWVANATDSLKGASIAFQVQGSYSNGTLLIQYLRSYDAAMAVAKVWLDADVDLAIALDGRWDSAGSQDETAIVPFRRLLRAGRDDNERTNHTLHVHLVPRADSDVVGKFKIVRVRTCENRSVPAQWWMAIGMYKVP